ncbi:MAG TPA: cupin domain-containing protein [Candidatus Lokiarchaeia archaeon]|nr:cupin domain-containing protein [Candidatus Lokiarchaeia archaeon]
MQGKAKSAGKESPVLKDVLGAVKDIESLIDYQENSVVSKMLIKKAGGNITLFAFDGQGLSEHSAPFDALVQCLDGEAIVKIAGMENPISKGQIIVLPANKPHAIDVSGGTRFKMMLVMIT